jgi:tetratricopeptide (TPR) repeat protein
MQPISPYLTINGAEKALEFYQKAFAAQPNACALESTCRTIRRTMAFPPAPAEFLKVLAKQAVRWGEYLHVINDFGECLDYLRQAIAKAKASA